MFIFYLIFIFSCLPDSTLQFYLAFGTELNPHWLVWFPAWVLKPAAQFYLIKVLITKSWRSPLWSSQSCVLYIHQCNLPCISFTFQFKAYSQNCQELCQFVICCDLHKLYGVVNTIAFCVDLYMNKGSPVWNLRNKTTDSYLTRGSIVSLEGTNMKKSN